ncbi:MAG: hypothetical protein R3B49_04560 [Phycisphaerales bacterium]
MPDPATLPTLIRPDAEHNMLVFADDEAHVFARLDGRSVLDPACSPEGSPGRVIVTTAWSGEGPAWLPAGWAALNDACDRLAPGLERAGVVACVRPGVADVLCDWPRTRAWAEERRAGPFEVLLDPVRLLTPAMLGQIEDHLDRMFDRLGPVAAGVVVAGGRAEGDRLVPCPLGEGAIDAGLMVRHALAAGLPIVVEEGAFDPQADLIRAMV